MLTETASHSLDLMVGEPVAYVQGLPKGHRADFCGNYFPDHQRLTGGHESGGAPLSLLQKKERAYADGQQAFDKWHY